LLLAYKTRPSPGTQCDSVPRRLRHIIQLVIGMVIIGSVALPARAATINLGVTTGGNLSYAGGNSPLVGTDIPIGSPALLSPTAFIPSGDVDFVTGPFSHFQSFGVTPAGNPAGGNAFFSSGGQVTFSGTLVTMQPGGINPQTVFNGVFFEGQFTDNVLLRLGAAGLPDERNSFEHPAFRGRLNPTFAALLQYPSDVFYAGGFFGLAPGPITGNLAPFSGGVGHFFGGLTSTTTPLSEPGGGGNGAPVIPEPSTGLLVASSLAGLRLWRRTQAA
jgi:hypothetical protein